MSTIYNRLFIAALAGISMVSCKEAKIQTYDIDAAAVYFQASAGITLGTSNEFYSNSSEISFAGNKLEIVEREVPVSLKILGNLENRDRKVSIVVDEERTTFPENGYRLNLDTISIKAGENSSKFKVIINRTERLGTRKDTLALKIVPNEDFPTPLNHYKADNVWNSSADTLEANYFFVIASELYSMPWQWQYTYIDYFGEWNPVKFKYINAVLDFTLDDWNKANSGGKIQQGRCPYYAFVIQNDLQKRADDGDPVFDEDGSYMQLAHPDYQVDYSKYQN